MKPSDTTRAERLLTRARIADRHSAAFLGYAAGKEFEDCSEWEKAFEAFDLGARSKRSAINFDEAEDARKFESVEAAGRTLGATGAPPGCPDPSPIFVVGQPRTGTTLIERIITSHSDIESAGELQQFRLSLARLSKRGEEGAPASAGDQWAAIDPRALGEEYLRVTKPMRRGAARFVDKLPGNYLYVPLILRALPNARIIHLTRDPMDACFSSFKQLFAEAYLHSYDQAEMARHYARYFRLMNAWREALPGRFLEVSYEETVRDLETNARRLIEFLGVPWQDACLNFHEQTTPVSTASAVQVREKAHTRSVGRWRRYGARLDPMRNELEQAGVLPVSGGAVVS